MNYEPDHLAIQKGILVPVADSVIMQFSGCWDHNDNPVYEGDVLLAYEKNWKVVFNEGAFVAWGPGRYRAIRMMWMPKIIGNMFENPDMLCYR